MKSWHWLVLILIFVAGASYPAPVIWVRSKLGV